MQRNKYNPFPGDFRGDKIKGAFCEIDLNPECSMYIIILPQRYFTHSMESLLEQEVPLEVIRPEIKLLGHIPKRDVYWLYVVMSFTVKKEFHTNQTIFAENRENYSECVFDNFDNVLDYCKRKFNTEIKDFGKDWETNYPQW